MGWTRGAEVEHVFEVRVGTRPIGRFARLIGREAFAETSRLGAALARRLDRKVVWNLNTTAAGGGVAEMLRPLLGYSRSVGIDARWLVVRGNPAFFRVTKRLHHALHGSEGDGSPLDESAHRIYRDALRPAAEELVTLVKPGDIVLLHDPQTAGLAPGLVRSGAHLIWRCHVGHDSTNAVVETGWQFLFPYLKEVPHYVFSRGAYIASYCDHGKAIVIQPSIDAFSSKNQKLERSAVHAILAHSGIVADWDGERGDTTFRRDDGSPGRVDRQAEIVREGGPPSWRTPLVLQVSRWDPLKDPVGVMRGFARLLEGGYRGGAHLALAGPDVRGVSDDPEGASTLAQAIAVWRELPRGVRRRVHLLSLPVEDVEENAAIVNALQRHAVAVVQKSLHEGFGLTVTEAMWKARPVVASAVGGIRDQIEDGVHGLLLRDPQDVDAFAASLRRVLEDETLARRLARAARQRVKTQFLGVRHLLEYGRLFASVID
jgi:trehalose synthase